MTTRHACFGYLKDLMNVGTSAFANNRPNIVLSEIYIIINNYIVKTICNVHYYFWPIVIMYYVNNSFNYYVKYYTFYFNLRETDKRPPCLIGNIHTMYQVLMR